MVTPLAGDSFGEEPGTDCLIAYAHEIATGFAQKSEMVLRGISAIGFAQEAQFYTSPLTKVNRWRAVFIRPAGYVSACGRINTTIVMQRAG